VVTATGWTHEAIREMSLGDVLGLLDYWRENPPSHVIMAARYLKGGAGQARGRQPAESGGDEMRELATLMGPPQPMKPYAKDLLDWADSMNRKK
jgi:hypothetical protein